MKPWISRGALAASAGLCIVLATACLQCNDKPTPPPTNGPLPLGDGYEISVAGKKIDVRPLASYEARRRVFLDNAELPKDGGLLIAHARSRYMSLWFTEPESATIRVDFLDAGGSIVDMQTLLPGERGITSEKEARYALLTRPELLTGLGAKKGDSVLLSEKIKKLQPGEMPTMKINGVPIYVDLSTLPDQRTRGLMYRTRMSANDGMLFVYPRPGERGFWMGHTHLPLSLAYIRADGTISQFHDMEMYPDPDHPPQDYKTWPSKEEVQYVLEVNWGFFKEHKLKEGMRVEFPEELKEYSPR